MKRKVVGLALLASLIISVTSGCIVREDYHRYHHHDGMTITTATIVTVTKGNLT